MIRPGLAASALRTLSLAACLLACSAACAGTDMLDLRRIGALEGDAAAGKTRAKVCSACHGPLGIAAVPLFPSLAGQKAEYLYWRLVAVKREAEPESPMTAQVAQLDDTAMRDLSAWFASLPAPVPTGEASDLAARGEALYRDGDSARGIPPCQGCHGAEAHGHPLAANETHWRVYPALRGQHAAYIAERLKDLGAEANLRSSSAHVMAPIARALDADAVAAIATWLESGVP